MDGRSLGEFTGALAARVFERALRDWETMIGLESHVELDTTRRLVDARAVADIGGPTPVAIETRTIGEIDCPLAFVLPVGLAAGVVAKALMLPDDAVEAILAKGLDEQDVEAFFEMANLFCGSASNALEEALGSLTVSQSVDHLRVHQGDGVSEMLSTSLGTGAFVASELEVHAEGAVHRVAWVTSSRAALGVFKLTHGQLRTST
ncbi:MAG: hypothetical protein GY711_08920 [bacterium]|nr:hypothetical protein [bacterium]